MNSRRTSTNPLGRATLGAALLLATMQLHAAGDGWRIGAVLDLAATSRALALGGRDQGLQLGHSDLTTTGPLGRHLHAQATAVFATLGGRVEKALEEAWVETRTLPLGLTARAGRFASQIGYLNEQHPHGDDFVERPLLYRAFLGGHWNDDGARLNVTLPAGGWYWMFGAELFRGRKLFAETEHPVRGVGAYTLVTRLGADLGRSHSWQLGASHLGSRRIAAADGHGHDEADEGDHADEDDHDHAHHHGARFGGRRTWMLDATWKWAPGGNNRQRQLRVTFEAVRITGVNRHASSRDRHRAWTAAAVWRFDPAWEAGVRADRLQVSMPHGDHFHRGRLHEQACMLAWRPSHGNSLRLQLARQGSALGIGNPARRSLQLQYVVAFGAHGAHTY